MPPSDTPRDRPSSRRRGQGLRRLGRGVRAAAGRSDVMVVAAALTAYATFGLVPLLAIGSRVAAALLGADRVREAADGLARYVPGPLGLDRHVIGFARAAAAAPWWTVLLALLPVSLFAEGVVRGLERFSRAPEHRSRTVRGRALTPLLVGFAVVAVVLLCGPVRPLLDGVGTGTGARLLGILLAFNLLFVTLFGALLVTYRLFASTSLRAGPLVAGAFVAASWIAGQLLGYTLAVRWVAGFAHAFGGYAPAATVAAIGFLIYLTTLIFVLGYLLALTLHEQPRHPASSTTSGR